MRCGRGSCAHVMYRTRFLLAATRGSSGAAAQYRRIASACLLRDLRGTSKAAGPAGMRSGRGEPGMKALLSGWQMRRDREGLASRATAGERQRITAQSSAKQGLTAPAPDCGASLGEMMPLAVA